MKYESRKHFRLLPQPNPEKLYNSLLDTGYVNLDARRMPKWSNIYNLMDRNKNRRRKTIA